MVTYAMIIETDPRNDIRCDPEDHVMILHEFSYRVILESLAVY